MVLTKGGQLGNLVGKGLFIRVTNPGFGRIKVEKGRVEGNETKRNECFSPCIWG